MATHVLNKPMHVGDLDSGILVDKLELVSIAINFQPVFDAPKDRPVNEKSWRDRVIISCGLRHAASDWIHTVTLSENTGHVWDENNRPVSKGVKAAEMWAALKAKFPELEKEILRLLQPYLSEGTIE